MACSGATLRPVMASFEDLVTELERSYADAQERMNDPAIYSDRRDAADAGRRLKELEAPAKLAQQWRQIRDDLADAKQDPELAGMAAELESELARLEEELKLALVERDPADEKDVIIEIRGAEGGAEAGIWAGDIYRMLTRYAEKRGFKVEDLDASPSDAGGFKEVRFAIHGDGAYSI